MPRFVRHGVVDSTNDRAFAALSEGSARDGDVHVARGQTAGRGRRGRKWSSPTDEGLYLSYVHLPLRPPELPGLLTMASGLAVTDCGRALGIDSVRLRWPNDVLADGAKLAGILVEARGYDPREPRFVIGIGINVDQEGFPEELTRERPVTSLRLSGVHVDKDELLRSVVDRLETRLSEARDAPRKTCSDYMSTTRLEGSEVEVGIGEARHVGLWEALTPDEGLVLRLMDGTTRELDPSVVSSVEPTGPLL